MPGSTSVSVRKPGRTESRPEVKLGARARLELSVHRTATGGRAATRHSRVTFDLSVTHTVAEPDEALADAGGEMKIGSLCSPDAGTTVSRPAGLRRSLPASEFLATHLQRQSNKSQISLIIIK